MRIVLGIIFSLIGLLFSLTGIQNPTSGDAVLGVALLILGLWLPFSKKSNLRLGLAIFFLLLGLFFGFFSVGSILYADASILFALPPLILLGLSTWLFIDKNFSKWKMLIAIILLIIAMYPLFLGFINNMGLICSEC